MKKVFTLVAFVTLTASAFAQYDHRNQKVHNYNDRRDYAYKSNGNRHDNSNWNNSYSFSPRERDMQIAQINREYNRKIQAIQSRRFMSYFKKQNMIRSLEAQRMNQVRIVYAKFNDPSNCFDGRDFNRH
jgi:hypothetical protein